MTMACSSSDQQCIKRMRKSSASESDWGELDSSLLESIFSGLPFKDALTVQSVCPHWNSVSKALLTSKSHAQSNRIPWLMLALEEEEGTSAWCCYINLEDKRVHEIDDDDNTVKELMEAASCIGSSHGWLIFLHHNVSVVLLNPFTQVKMQLPCLDCLLGTSKIYKNMLGEYCVTYNNQNWVSYTYHLRENVIYKGVLSSDPCLDVDNLGVVVIYGRARKLAFCNYGDHGLGSSWSELDGKFRPYHDITCHRNKLYALGGNNACVEAWDLDGSVPIKSMEIELSFPAKSMKMLNDFRYLYTWRSYLVENLEGWLLVVRYIGEFVNENDEVVEEGDLLTDEDTHPLVCPYKTLLFHVYKLDFDERRWIEVESLGESAPFLGGGQSISVTSRCNVSGYKKNSIYFTDDYWERMMEDYLYGGHDMGVFGLENQKVEPIYQSNSTRFQLPPCWVAPSLW